jgi:hypothetical protein
VFIQDYKVGDLIAYGKKEPDIGLVIFTENEIVRVRWFKPYSCIDGKIIWEDDLQPETFSEPIEVLQSVNLSG